MNCRKLLTIFVATGLGLTACGSDDNAAEPSPTAAVTTPDSAPSGDASAVSDTTVSDTTTVKLATTESLGEYLVDAEGRTLYLFDQDEGTTTACTGGCADNWPPIVADGTPTGGDGVDASQLGTADGILPNQVTYFGHLLYYFAGDQVPGDTNGTAIASWFAVDPAGTAIAVG